MYSSMKKESFSNPFQNESWNPSTNKESFIREWKGHGLTRRAGSSRPRNIISILSPPPQKKLSPVEGMHALQIRCTVVLVKTENGREEQKLFPWPYARPIATPSCAPTIDENLRFSFPSGPFEIVAFRIFLSLSLSLSLSLAFSNTDTDISFPFHSVKIIPHTRCATSFFVLPKFEAIVFYAPSPPPSPFPLPPVKTVRASKRSSDFVISSSAIFRSFSSPPSLFFAPAMGHTYILWSANMKYIYIYIYTDKISSRVIAKERGGQTSVGQDCCRDRWRRLPRRCSHLGASNLPST